MTQSFRDHITTDAIAQDLDVHVNTVQRWLQTGELKGTRIGPGQRGVWLVSKKDYKHFKRSYKKWSWRIRRK